MSKYDIIAFTGPIGSGKTTACEYFHQHYVGITHRNFAAPIKHAVCQMFGFSMHQCTDTDLKEVVDPILNFSPRKAMQLIGTEVGRQLNPDVWIMHMIRSLAGLRSLEEIFSSSHPFKGLVIGDLRFPNEAAWVRKNNGLVVHIFKTRADRLHEHSSEKGIDIDPGADYVIRNDAGLTEYEAQLKLLAGYCGIF